MPESIPATETAKSVRQLLVIVAVLVLGYECMQVFRFTVGRLNQIFVYAYLLVPFFAIRPVRRLRQRFKTLGWIFLTPLLLLSSCGVMAKLAFGAERIEPLQFVQGGGSTIEIGRYENGGAIGVHGVYLEQRRHIVPGLYLVRSIDFFDEANGATMSVDGPYRIRVHAQGNYGDPYFKVDRAYSLKPWLYF